VVRNTEASFPRAQRLLVQYDKVVPSRAKIAAFVICVCIKFAVNAVLVHEKEEQGKFKQIPVYFSSEVVSGSKNLLF
jgi:putative flippase GtrA